MAYLFGAYLLGGLILGGYALRLITRGREVESALRALREAQDRR